MAAQNWRVQQTGELKKAKKLQQLEGLKEPECVAKKTEGHGQPVLPDLPSRDMHTSRGSATPVPMYVPTYQYYTSKIHRKCVSDT